MEKWPEKCSRFSFTAALYSTGQLTESETDRTQDHTVSQTESVRAPMRERYHSRTTVHHT